MKKVILIFTVILLGVTAKAGYINHSYSTDGENNTYSSSSEQFYTEYGAYVWVQLSGGSPGRESALAQATLYRYETETESSLYYNTNTYGYWYDDIPSYIPGGFWSLGTDAQYGGAVSVTISW